MKYGDRIQATTSSTGTGTLTLGTVPNSFFDFTTHLGSGLFPVVIFGGVESEISLCSLSGSTLTRVKCIKSTNGNAFVNFSAGTKYVFLDYISEVLFAGTVQLKPLCRTVGLTNVTLSTLTDGASYNGLILATGDLILLTGQSTPTQNGIHQVTVSTPVRPIHYYTGDVAEAIVPVDGQLWLCDTPTAVIDTNNITFTRLSTNSPTSSTDNAITRFDGTNGKLQNSVVTVNDDGKVEGKASASAIYVTTGNGTINLDCGLYNYFDITANGNVTLTVSNASLNQPIFLRFRQDGTGSRTLTFFSGISWDGNVALSPVGTASHWSNYGFICRSLTGPVWDAFLLGQDFQ